MKEIMTKFKGLDLREAYLLDVLVLTNFVLRSSAYRIGSSAARTIGLGSCHWWLNSGWLSLTLFDCCCSANEYHSC